MKEVARSGRPLAVDLEYVINAAGLCLLLAILWGAVTTVHAASTPRDDIAAATRRALDHGAYEEARRYASEWLADAERQGPDSPEALEAVDAWVEVHWRSGLSNVADVVSRAVDAVRARESRQGPESLDVTGALHNLGAIRTERGEFTAAVGLHRRALTIRRRHLPPHDPATADSLDHLALPLIYMERFAEARQLIEEAKSIRGSVTESRSSHYTAYLDALCSRWQGSYAAGAKVTEALLAQMRSGSDHPDQVLVLQLNGDLAFLMGDAVSARRDWTAAVTLAQRVLGEEHPVLPRLFRVLSGLSAYEGGLTEARPLLEKATAIAARSLAPCHKEHPTLLNDLAALLFESGEYERARTVYDQALERSTRCLGANQSLTATILYNQGNLFFRMGDLIEAERFQRRALRAWSTGLGPRHPYVARGFDALAETAATSGRLVRARTLLARALVIRQQALGPTHPDVALTLVSLARVAERAGSLSLAARRVDEAMAIYDHGGVPQDPDYLASAIELRAAIASRRGDATRARADAARAAQLRERVFGPTHPLTARSRVQVAAAEFALGDYSDAIDAALVGDRDAREHLRLTIRSLPERQALAYADRRPRGLDVALSAVAERPESASTLLDTAIRSRSLVLDEFAGRAHVAPAVDAASAPLRAAVAEARTRFARLMLRSLEGDGSVSATALDAVRRQMDEAERALAARSADARLELLRADAGLEAVRRALPVDSALISFVRYDRRTLVTAGAVQVPRVQPSYVAFVLAPDGVVTATDLGAAATIDRLVDAWRAEADGRALVAGAPALAAGRAYRVRAAQLRRRIWDPVASRITNASQVFLVPDGALHLVSFAALPAADGRYLVEEGPVLHLLSAERDLVLEDVRSPAGRGLLAVGAPSYDRPDRAASVPLRAGCLGAGGLRFGDLPGARAEVRDIARFWSAHAAGDGASRDESGASGTSGALVLSGAAASKRAVLREAGGRRVVHLATHGFFLGGPCELRSAGTRGVGRVIPIDARSNREQASNPLLVSGLAFAGANGSSPSARADGVLTAEEVASLNLQGTEWAVLSACDTGRGEIRAGEGVFGLRRAFQVAGVRTVIMSLWAVEDQSTRLWMEALYRSRFEQHLSTAQSVRNAQLHVLRTRRAQGQSTHPFYWAGFVASGDWN